MLDIQTFQELSRKGDHVFLVFLRSPGLYDQQRRFSAAELYVLYLANFAISVKDRASGEIAQVDGTIFQFSSLFQRHLYLTADQLFCLADGISTGKLQNDLAFVEPVVVQLDLTAAVRFVQSVIRTGLREPFGEVCQQHGCNFTNAALGLDHFGHSHKLALKTRLRRSLAEQRG